MVRVYFADTALLPDPAQESGFYSKLPGARLEKALRLKLPEKRRESAGAGLLLSCILPRFGATAGEVYADARGKLYHPRLTLCLAHGGGRVVLAVGTEPVGCDIEELASVREGVLRRFSEAERAFVEGAGEKERARAAAFCRIWTGKESFLKWTGEGLAGWKGTEVSFPDGRIFRNGKEQPCRVVWREWGEYIVAVCSGEETAEAEEIFLEGNISF